MQENSFEDRVRQQMEELQFQPTEPVWQKVAAQIGAKKRKRRVVLLLLPLLLLSGGLLWYYTGQDDLVNQPSVAEMEQQTRGAKVQPAGTEHNSGTTSLIKQPDVTKRAKTDNIITELQKGKETFLKNQQTAANNIKREKKYLSAIKEPAQANAEDLLFEENDLHAQVLQNEIEKREGGKKEETSNDFSQSGKEKEIKNMPPFAVLKQRAVADSIVVADSAAGIVAVAKGKEDSTAADLLLPAVQHKKEKEKKWQWTVQARVGVSGLRAQVGDVFAQELSADFTATPSNGNPAPAFSNAAAIKNGVAFTLGAGVRKKMFKKAFISAGLQYSRYSTQTHVGTPVAADTIMQYNGRFSNVSSYYRSSGATRKYTTQYHYLEVPLAFDYSLFKVLQVQHGISIGRLLSTNALYFDKTARVWYASDDWLRKTGFHVFTSIEYPLLQTKKFTLLAGPQMQWGLLPAQVKQEPKKHHLFFAGLGTRMHF